MLMTSRNARTRRQQRGRDGRIKTGPQAQTPGGEKPPELPIACSTEPAYSQEVQEKIHRQAAKKSESLASIEQSRNVPFFAFRFLRDKSPYDAEATVGCRRWGINRFSRHYAVAED
jgi:hypothetical protein